MVDATTIPLQRTLTDHSNRSGNRTEESDQHLFERFIAGDEGAMMDLFDRHHHRIYLYCFKILGNKETAEDIAQEHWLRLIRYLRGDAEVTSPVSLMLTIARNLCLNHLRVSRPQVSIDDILESEHPVIFPRELSHLEELVVLSLPKLPFAQREVLVLHAYCGYRFEDIANMLGQPIGTVRMRASRARAHLGRIISAIVEMEEDREKHRNTNKPDEGNRL